MEVRYPVAPKVMEKIADYFFQTNSDFSSETRQGAKTGLGISRISSASSNRSLYESWRLAPRLTERGERVAHQPRQPRSDRLRGTGIICHEPAVDDQRR